MKKGISLFLAVAVFLNAIFSFSLLIYADDDIERTQIGTSSAYYEYDSQSQTLTISGSGAVPSFSNNSSSIPWYQLRLDRKITNVVVEEGITSLGTYALYQVKASSISLPSTLKSLGVYSLAYSTGITNLELPFGFERIEGNALLACNAIQSVNLPKTLKSIGASAFQNCLLLKIINIPYNVKSIGSGAFSGCTALTQVEFDSLASNVSIGASAFEGCTNLIDVSIPLGSELGDRAFGYKNSSSKINGAKMHLFDESAAYYYALTNGIKYSLIDSIPIKCGVVYKGGYTENNLEDVIHYTFSADSGSVYNFYSRGSADLKATLKNSNGETIASADDISWTDRNFCISASLEAGNTYDLYVYSNQSEGEFTVQVYPYTMRSISVYGEIELNADEAVNTDGNNYYEINENKLSKLVVEVYYSTGLYDKVYYSSGYFNRKEFSYSDEQQDTPFVCGDNTGIIKLGSLTASVKIKINHSYTKEIVYPTFESQGYAIYTCNYCGAQYTADYVDKYVTSVSGNVVLSEDESSQHEHNIPYTHLLIIAQGREYAVNSDGSFTVFLSYDGDILFDNLYGDNLTLSATTQNSNYDLGTVALDGYDLNGDNVVNAKDFALSIREYKNTDIKIYFEKYAYNFY